MSDTEKPTKRTELKRESIALQMRIDNVKFIVDQSTSPPDERADNVLLLRLFLLLKHYLEDQQNLPFIKEEERQLKTLNPTAVPPREVAETLLALGHSPSVSARQEQASLKVACAESGIREFHHLLPWWHETYTMTKQRIDARAAKIAPVITTPAEPEMLPEPVSSRNGTRSPAGRAAEDAWSALGPDAAFAKVCGWIDENRGTPCPYGGGGKWAVQWEKPSKEKQKEALDQYLRRRRQKVFPVQ